jgi:hydroxyethylthiazole kinase-like uncharacterized protein yjeF
MEQVPRGSLMQMAARGLASHCLRLVREVRGSISGTRVVLLVGAGNNGGDALFAGAHLQSRGMAVTALPTSDSWHVEGMQALLRAGGQRVSLADIERSLHQADLIIDGIVGIGARGDLREPAANLVLAANAADSLRVAVDLPSGVAADTGHAGAVAFDADLTVTFGCYKPGLFMHPGCALAGAVHLVDIGLAPQLPKATMGVIELADVADFVAAPAVDDHKYRRGVVGIAAGSTTYPGAAVLAVSAARYAGVGMVRFLDRGDGLAARVIDEFPDVVADPRDTRSDDRVRAWGCGSGFTESDEQTVAMMIAEPTPIVLDAGALHCLALSEHLRTGIRARANQGLTTVVTPHQGEYLRLFGDQPPSEIAAAWGAIVVHKGPATTITRPDGVVFVDPMGTSDLACAGSGDVLTGVMSGLLAANPDDDPAFVAAAAVWLHGLGGRIAATGERPVTAVDISAALPHAIAAVRTGNRAGWRL